MAFERTVVTGGVWFLGSHVRAELVRRGPRVVRVDDFRTSAPANLRGWPDFSASLRAQRGNVNDTLMRRLLGPGRRVKIGCHPGRLRWHAAMTAAGAAAVLSRKFDWRKGALLAGSVWTIPPAAFGHQLRGELRHRVPWT